MYEDYHALNTPPPRSQFRRPWSPEPFDPRPPASPPPHQQLQASPSRYIQSQHHQDQREGNYDYQYDYYNEEEGYAPQPARRYDRGPSEFRGAGGGFDPHYLDQRGAPQRDAPHYQSLPQHTNANNNPQLVSPTPDIGLEHEQDRARYSRYPQSAQPGASQFLSHSNQNIQSSSLGPHAMDNGKGKGKGRAVQREASDVSVEALDLADYARTLQHRQDEQDQDHYTAHQQGGGYEIDQHGQHPDPYPAHYPPDLHPPPGSDFTPLPPPTAHQAPRPRNGGQTNSNLLSPPSSYTADTNRRGLRDNHRRPLSVPPPTSFFPNAAFTPQPRPTPASASGHGYSYSNKAPRKRQAPPVFRGDREGEDGIDVSRFPKWSRGWYKGALGGSEGAKNGESQGMDGGLSMGMTAMQGLGQAGPMNMPSPFDPGYVAKYDHNTTSAYDTSRTSVDPYAAPSAVLASMTTEPPPSFSSAPRNILPWNDDDKGAKAGDPPAYGGLPNSASAIDQMVKEERIRMLEREFGVNPTTGQPNNRDFNGSKMNNKNRKGRDDDAFTDQNGKPLIGTVDSRGYLVTEGPKKRWANRGVQIILAGLAAGPGIYAALAIKPNPKAPPAGSIAAYVLYALSSVFFVILLYLNLFRPLCFPPRRRNYKSAVARAAEAERNPLAGGMMVLPTMQGGPGGKKGGKAGKYGGYNKKDIKKWKKGKGPPPMPMPGDVQVNLIVDPNAFGRGKEYYSSSSSEDDNSEDDIWNDATTSSALTGSAGSKNRNKKRKKKGGRRRSVFAGLAMEEEWKRARGWTKKMVAVDAVGTLVWGAVFVYVMMGKRCPSGGFEGWCNAYNVSTAAACLLCVSFALAIFLDVKDLHATKVSPRTRYTP